MLMLISEIQHRNIDLPTHRKNLFGPGIGWNTLALILCIYEHVNVLDLLIICMLESEGSRALADEVESC